MDAALLEKARGIRWLVLDVDGVMTDGRILLDGAGGEWKAFDVRDGHRIVLGARRGLRFAFMTGRTSAVVARRAQELGVARVFQGVRDKGAALEAFLAAEGAAAAEVAYLGDDLVDLPALRRCGLAGAVADAVPEVLAAADWVAASRGGRGAVREFVELVLRAQGLWEEIVAECAR